MLAFLRTGTGGLAALTWGAVWQEIAGQPSGWNYWIGLFGGFVLAGIFVALLFAAAFKEN